jgi:hypothetical protein
MDAQLGEILFEERTDIALAPFMAFDGGGGKIGPWESAPEPEGFMVVDPDLGQGQPSNFMIENTTGEAF